MTDKTEAPSAPDARPVIPEGWKLVPEDATEIMINAALSVDWASDGDERGIAHNVYHSMVAAAPAAPLRTETEVSRRTRNETLQESAAVADECARAWSGFDRIAAQDVAKAIRAKISAQPTHQDTQALIVALRRLVPSPNVGTQSAKELIYDAAQRLETLAICLNPEDLKDLIERSIRYSRTDIAETTGNG